MTRSRSRLTGQLSSAGAAGSRSGAGRCRAAGEGVPAEQVDVRVGERGQPGRGGVVHAAGGAELAERGVGVPGVPQHDGVQDQAERAELVLLPFAVGLAQLAALAVEDLAGQPVTGFLDGELPVHGAPVGLVGGVDEG